MSNGVCYRRGSLFWALVLIGVGSLFLYRNLHPEFPIWQILGRYWPLLIIFWGLGKLVDYFALRDQPGRSVFLTGGEIFLLLMILLVGTAISKGTQPGAWPIIQISDEDWPFRLGDRFEFSDTLSQAAKPSARFDISNEEGTVNIAGTTENRIAVSVHKTVYAGDETQAKEIADSSTVKIAEVVGGYELRANRARTSKGRTVRIDLDVQVPATSSVRVTSGGGEVHVSGITGNVEVTGERADVELDQIQGNAIVSLRKGSLRASEIKGNCQLSGRGSEVELEEISGEANLQGEFYGPIKVSKVAKLTRFVSSRTDLSADRLAGQMEVESGTLYLTGVRGPATIVTRNKDITIEDFSSRLRIENNRGNIELIPRSLEADIDVENRSGGIALSVPHGASFEINATARSGHIESDLSDPGLRLNEGTDTGTLQGHVGTRGPLVRLTTTYGTIQLRTVEPAPPPPPTPRAPRAAPGVKSLAQAEMPR